MTNLINTLYAPIVATFMPAFVNEDPVKVYFTYSPLNDVSLIKRVHVSVVNQTTNENALQDLTGIAIYETSQSHLTSNLKVQYDNSVGMYYIVISPDQLKYDEANSQDGNTVWNINQFYKVQIRLDSNSELDSTYQDNEAGKYIQKMEYLTEYQEWFSEWSTVCLLRPISRPIVRLTGLINPNPDDVGENYSEIPAFNKGIIPINGNIKFEGGNSETETLQSYKLEIYQRNTNNLIYSTPSIYTGNLVNPNEINYKLNLQGINTSDTTHFTLKVIITTRNQYTNKDNPASFDFDIADFVEMTDFHPIGINNDEKDHSLTVTFDEEKGIASFRFINDVAVYGILYVKRSSSISNFTEWESIYEANVNNTLDITITDSTVGSHIWYQYSIQLENNQGGLSNIYYTNLLFPEFFDTFFSRQDMILPLRYDFKVSSVKPNVNRAKIDTLGGRYPKFAENAVLNYKQFSISGIISADGDWFQEFINKRTYYGSNYDNYRIYLDQDNIQDLVRNDSKDWDRGNGGYLTTTYNDWFWEREFREQVVAWLNDGEPKLFRSMTEGIIPVMLMDINLTPKAEMGRRLYDFSATMYEIAEGHSLNTLNSLGIIDVPYAITRTAGNGEGAEGDGSGPIENYRTVTVVGQVYNYTIPNSNDLITHGEGIISKQLTDKYAMGGIYSTRESVVQYIQNVQLYFHSQPHRYYMPDQNNILVVDNNNIPEGRMEPAKDKDIQLGYKFGIVTEDGQIKYIFVNSRGYYQIPNHLKIKGIFFPGISQEKDNVIFDTVSINYIAVCKEENTSNSTPSGQSIVKTIVGQYQGVYSPESYLGEKIRKKYSYIQQTSDMIDYIQQMQFWKGISLDVTPYAVAYIKYNGQENYNKYVVGHTGILHLLHDCAVKDMCFLGRRLVKQPFEKQKYLAEHEFVIDPKQYSKIVDVKRPIANTVYHIGSDLMIYHYNQWAPFTEEENNTGIAAVNVEGAINYYGDVIQITY